MIPVPPYEGCSHQLERLTSREAAASQPSSELVEGARSIFFGHRLHPLPKERGDQPRLKLTNEGSLLLCEGSVCAPGHKARQSTNKAPNFGELRKAEVRRILLK